MESIFSLIPFIAFFVVYKYNNDIYSATAVGLVLSIVFTALEYLKNKTLSKNTLFSLGAVIILGGSTILFHNDKFIMWKPTVIYWFFTGALISSLFFGKKTLIEKVFPEDMEVSTVPARHATTAIAMFFLVMGFVNLYVANNYTQDDWVNFKVIYSSIITLVYMALVMLYLARHAKKVPGSEEEKNEPETESDKES